MNESRIPARRLAVLTSGGDAPGMNCAVRAMVRTALLRGFQVMGIQDGYRGLIAGRFKALGPRSVGGIVQSGGTFLGTSRCEEMRHPEGVDLAARRLQEHAIEGLVVIGGNGSQTGAFELSKRGVAVVGVASTIDNDLEGTDISIGAMTAVDTALEAIDRIRTTAASHHRVFLIEVMGRNCGYLAMMAGIAGGAEAIAVPEDTALTPQSLCAELLRARARGKSHAIVVVSEGARHDIDSLAHGLHGAGGEGFDVRICKIGHIQRGGSPGAFDRVLASRLGSAASEALADGHHGVLIGMAGGRVTTTPLSEIAGKARAADIALLTLATTLAT